MIFVLRALFAVDRFRRTSGWWRDAENVIEQVVDGITSSVSEKDM
jgi:hypothetical protein